MYKYYCESDLLSGTKLAYSKKLILFDAFGDLVIIIKTKRNEI